MNDTNHITENLERIFSDLTANPHGPDGIPYRVELSDLANRCWSRCVGDATHKTVTAKQLAAFIAARKSGKQALAVTVRAMVQLRTGGTK